MKKMIILLFGIVMLVICVSCKGQELDIKPEITQMQAICELAVMDCYYHNVAKFEEKDAAGALFWKKDKKFWVEYDGIVKFGVNASLVRMELKDDIVVITIPKAEVLSCTVDSESLTEDSFYVAPNSANIVATDETDTYAVAQDRMRETAENDQFLLSRAQEQAQTLLENYVKNIGAAIGKEYSVQWEFI